MLGECVTSVGRAGGSVTAVKVKIAGTSTLHQDMREEVRKNRLTIMLGGKKNLGSSINQQTMEDAKGRGT